MPDLGSRLALSSDDGRALALWTDARAGTVASNKQDLAGAVVRLPGRSGARLPPAVTGVLAVLAALAMATGSRRNIRRPSSSDTTTP